MENQAQTQNHSTLYNGAGLIHVKALSKVETPTNGQHKMKANPFPNHALIKEQPKYGPNSGDYYALLMGREFLPGRFVLLLDFDNKDDGAVNGMQLIEKLNVDQYGAPCQKSPLGWKTLPFLCRRSTKRANHIQNDNCVRGC